MGRVVLNPDQSAALDSSPLGVEVVKADGTVVGKLIPQPLADDFESYVAERRRRDRAFAELTLDELRAMDTGEGIPHDEVMKRLGLR
jgi:hypothetical protein